MVVDLLDLAVALLHIHQVHPFVSMICILLHVIVIIMNQDVIFMVILMICVLVVEMEGMEVLHLLLVLVVDE